MLQGLNLRLQAHTPLGIQLTLNAHLVKGWECGTKLNYKLLLVEPCINHFVATPVLRQNEAAASRDAATLKREPRNIVFPHEKDRDALVIYLPRGTRISLRENRRVSDPIAYPSPQSSARTGPRFLLGLSPLMMVLLTRPRWPWQNTKSGQSGYDVQRWWRKRWQQLAGRGAQMLFSPPLFLSSSV